MFYTHLICFSVVAVGLNAGLYFIFSNTVMKALGQLKPHEGIAAMQNINRVILNPLFFFVFFGPALSSVILIIMVVRSEWENPGGVYVFIGSLLYLVGSILVTMICNVPRNEALDKIEVNDKNGVEVWSMYLREWTMWNHVRTVACTLSVVFYVLGII